jgi:hypothetical protein
MMWSMTLAYFCTLIAYLCAEPTESIELMRVAADPPRGENTNVTTVAAQSRTACHHVVAMMLHADHVVCARLASPSARETGIDAVLLLLRQRC